MTTLLISNIVLSVITVFGLILCLVYLKKANKAQPTDSAQITEQIKNLENNQREFFKTMNELVLSTIKNNNDSILKTIASNHSLQYQQQSDLMTKMTHSIEVNEKSMRHAIEVLEAGLNSLRQDNEKKLEQMRQTVDEKLNVSLENRLSQSFNIINERLQSVYEGIGVMKQLASGVGDLKKVLTNVKSRGVWGEISLGNLLEQTLTHEQFASQININPSNSDRVDFAVILPGKAEGQQILLPIDAKFPIEDYQRLIDASEHGTKEDVDMAQKGIERRIKEEAKKIKEKYIMIPKTTDFAVMYLSIEGLYAEVLRIPGLVEQLQRDYKITVCGPTTLSAMLNSLQLGFKTLSIEKRSSEVWNLLNVFKQEFSKFVELLAKTQKKLTEASNTIEFATKKSKTIERKLKSVSGTLGEPEELELIEEVTDGEQE